MVLTDSGQVLARFIVRSTPSHAGVHENDLSLAGAGQGDAKTVGIVSELGGSGSDEVEKDKVGLTTLNSICELRSQ